MNARELRKLLRRQTGCSYHRMIVQDKNYDAIRCKTIWSIIDVYKKDQKSLEGEEWDCDDIARDFWNYAKLVIQDATGENGIIGLVILPDHTETVYAHVQNEEHRIYTIYYIDQRDWSIDKPNRKPKWIIM